jgi:uncharacterized protein
MEQMPNDALQRLTRTLEGIGPLAVALSGGVDSMTLAVVAQRTLGRAASMIHAVSPAVPEEATARVRRYARVYAFDLSVIDAREFEDPSYLANPANRCFFCKTSLYSSMRARVETVLVSGTNTDDLADYRPGLAAAAAHGVRHPYVEAHIDKAGVRAIARRLELDDIAELPASPCLSSRIETGLPIVVGTLRAVHRVERFIQRELEPRVVRCRIRRGEAIVELDAETLARLDHDRALPLAAEAVRLLAEAGAGRSVEFRPYRMGSAFLRAAVESVDRDGTL